MEATLCWRCRKGIPRRWMGLSTVMALALGTDTRPAHAARLRRSATGHATGLDRGASMHQYDKSTKWLIQHHGDSILRLVGMLDIVSWQPLPAELVQSRRLPDGLIEVRRHGQAEPDLYVLEIATYPEARVADQVVNDTALVYLDRRVLPEVVVLFLHPRGISRPPAPSTCAAARAGPTGGSPGGSPSCGRSPPRNCWPRPTSA